LRKNLLMTTSASKKGDSPSPLNALQIKA